MTCIRQKSSFALIRQLLLLLFLNCCPFILHFILEKVFDIVMYNIIANMWYLFNLFFIVKWFKFVIINRIWRSSVRFNWFDLQFYIIFLFSNSWIIRCFFFEIWVYRCSIWISRLSSFIVSVRPFLSCTTSWLV